MKAVHLILFAYVFLFSLVVAMGAATEGGQANNPFILIVFLPVLIHFILAIGKPKSGHKWLLYYNFIITSIMAISGFLGAKNLPETISAVLFLPITLYFWLLVLPKRSKKINLLEDLTPSEIPAAKTESQGEPKVEADFDVDRRTFIKLVGSIGLGVFFLSLLNRKVENTFFSRIGNPSGSKTTVQKNSQNSQDQAKIPTDNYKITEIDDSVPTYLGFVDNTGQWFIMQETDSGSFRYTKGASNFPASWPKRADLNYDFYNNVF